MTYWPNGLLIKPIIQWPGEPTPWSRRQRAPFRSSWSSTLEVLERELRVISAKARVLQVDIAERDFRIDGYPRANAKANGPGVILTFDAFGGSLSYPCDTFDDWQDNVRAIALALEALRKVDRYGVTKRGEQYAGFKALGSGLAMPTLSPHDAALELLKMGEQDPGFADDLLEDAAMVGDAFRAAAKIWHPDRPGGDAIKFRRATLCRDILLRTAR